MATENLELATAYDAGEGWEGDSAGSDLRASDTAVADKTPAKTPTPPPATPDKTGKAGDPPELDVDDDDVLPDDEREPQHAEDDEDEEPGEGETDEEREAREAEERGDTDRKPRKKETWKERQRRIATERANLSRETREMQERHDTLARATQELEERHNKLRADLDTLEKQREKRGEEAPAAVAALGDEPTWEKYDADGKSLDEFHRDHAAWMRKSIAAELDAKLSSEIEKARKAGEESTVKRLEEKQRADRELAIHNEFVERRDKYFAEHPGVFELGSRTIGDLNSRFLNTVVVRHPAGMKLYEYLARHPRQAEYFRDRIEPMITQPIIDVVRRSDDPTRLVAYFVSKPEEVRRLAALSPADALIALGELNASLRTSGVQPATSRSSAPLVTRAAPPLRSVAGRHSGRAERDDDEKHPDEWTPADAARIFKKSKAQPRR